MHRCKRCVNISEYQLHDSVAQLDRAFDYESKGQGFESLLGHQIKASQQCGAFYFTDFYNCIIKGGYRTKRVGFIGDGVSKLLTPSLF